MTEKLRRPLRNTIVESLIAWEVVVAAVGKDPAARSVQARPRRLPDVQVHPGLAEAVRAEPSSDDDPLHRDGYEHYLWLEEWMELAVGAETFDRVEGAVTAHPLVDAAMHMDREVLYVAAPTLPPEDVRQVVLATVANAYDPEWSRSSDTGPSSSDTEATATVSFHVSQDDQGDTLVGLSQQVLCRGRLSPTATRG